MTFYANDSVLCFLLVGRGYAGFRFFNQINYYFKGVCIHNTYGFKING